MLLAGPFTQRGTLFGKGALPVVESKLRFLEERHKVIAHNIANVHTRYYKTQDLPFAEFDDMLKNSMAARDEKHVKVYEEHADANVYSNSQTPGQGRYVVHNPKLSVMRHGDNNVDIDREVAKLSRNTMLFRSMSAIAKKNYDLLRATIRETP